MNTLEILYQAFRVRYSLNQLQQILDRGCRLGVLTPEGHFGTIKEYLGQPIPGMDERDPSVDLVEISWDLDDESLKELRICDACVVYFPEGPPEVDALEELAEKLPIHVKTLWVCASDGGSSQAIHERDLTLPTVRSLGGAQSGPVFLRLLLASLPQVSLVLARDWTHLREVFCQTLTRRTALRNGVRAGISSLPLRSVPVIGPVLSLLATSAETMMLTSSQLRLSFVIAAVHGRPLDFFDRISELWPIVGSAFGFRGVSRALVKLLPVVGPGMKASVAFAGTFAVGEASRLYYHSGEPTSDEVRREILRRSQEEGDREAQRLLRRIMMGETIDDVDYGGTEVIELVEGLTGLEQVVSDPIVGEAIAELSEADEAKVEKVGRPTSEAPGEAESPTVSGATKAEASSDPASPKDGATQQVVAPVSEEERPKTAAKPPFSTKAEVLETTEEGDKVSPSTEEQTEPKKRKPRRAKAKAKDAGDSSSDKDSASAEASKPRQRKRKAKPKPKSSDTSNQD